MLPMRFSEDFGYIFDAANRHVAYMKQLLERVCERLKTVELINYPKVFR